MPSDGLFSLAIVYTRALVRFGPKERADLLQICGAGVEDIDQSQLSNSLNRWTELGLFREDGGTVHINETCKKSLGKDVDQVELRLPKIMREIALSEKNNLRFWEADANKSADFSRGLSWILAQNVYELNTSSHKPIQALELSQINLDRCALQNDTRWNGLRFWMLYLGFGRNAGPFTVDPTEALRDCLPRIFAAEDELTASEFFSRAAEALPVLDGGAYRRQVEDILQPEGWQRPKEGQLSTSLSRAIKRLVQDGTLIAAQKSDTEGGVELIGINHRSWALITHLRLAPQRERTDA